MIPCSCFVLRARIVSLSSVHRQKLGTKKSDSEAAASVIGMMDIFWVKIYLFIYFFHSTSSPYCPVFLVVFFYHFIGVSLVPDPKAFTSTFSLLITVNSVTLKNNKMIKQSAANVPAGRMT